jgi:hypothetical protein
VPEVDEPSVDLDKRLDQDTSNENIALQTFGYVNWVNDKVMAQYLPEAVDAESALAERMGLIHMPLEDRFGQGKQHVRKKKPQQADPRKTTSVDDKLIDDKSTTVSQGWRTVRNVLHAFDEGRVLQTPETLGSTRASTPWPGNENDGPYDEAKEENLFEHDPVAARLKAAMEQGQRDPNQLKKIKRKKSDLRYAVRAMSRYAKIRSSICGGPLGKRTTIAMMPSNSGSVVPAGYESSCLSRGPFRKEIEFEHLAIPPKDRWMIHLLSDNDEDIDYQSLGKTGPQMLITCHNDVHHGEYNPLDAILQPENEDKDQLKQNVQMATPSKVQACPFCQVAVPVDAIQLACGHSFCRAHLVDLLRTWEASGIHTCPKCGEVEPQPGSLQLHSQQFDKRIEMTRDFKTTLLVKPTDFFLSPQQKKPSCRTDKHRDGARRYLSRG